MSRAPESEPPVRRCRRALKRAIPFDCKGDVGHTGDCSPYTRPPTGRWLEHGFVPKRGEQ